MIPIKIIYPDSTAEVLCCLEYDGDTKNVEVASVKYGELTLTENTDFEIGGTLQQHSVQRIWAAAFP